MQLYGLGHRLANAIGLGRDTPPALASPLEPREQVSVQGPLRLQMGDGSSIALPGEGQTLTIGRHADNQAVIADPQVSRHHAMLACQGGQYYIRDLGSHNGTRVNGVRVDNHWVPLPPNGHITLGSNVSASIAASPAAPPPAREEQIPDGRTVLVSQLSGGHLKVSKVDFSLAPDKYNPEDFYDLKAGKPVKGLPTVGQDLLCLKGGRPRAAEYLGTDATGQMRFGHTNEYTAETWQQYLKAQQAEIDRKAEAAEAKARKRSEGAIQLRQQEMQRIGLTPEHLAHPAAAAQLLLQHGGKLAYDGQDLWPREVQSEVMGQKRAELEAAPELKQRGLVDIRLQEFMAANRGEFVLYRGLKGEYNPAEPGRFYTTDPGCALGTYAKDEGSTGCVVAMRIPKTDAYGFYREVGMVPGRNKYADVVDIGPSDLKQYDKPYVVISSNRPDQRWMFDRLKANGDIDNSEKGLDDYWRIVADITGKRDL